MHYARLRPRLSKLTLPWVWLGLISAGISFASTYDLATWLLYAIWATSGVLLIILFLLPSLHYAATYLDVHDRGLSIRLGLGSAKRIDVDWITIATISASPLRGIIVRTKEENEYVLRGYSNQKALVAELVSILGRK